MQIVRDLAGYSYGRSDLVRRAMAKKKHSVMEKEREYFVHGQVDENGQVVIPGCVRNGVPEDIANHIYDEMISFASYAFNKSHAAAYGVVTMQTAWLKKYHPVPYMAAIINSVYGNSGKIAAYIQYCRSKGIPVLEPDINHSVWKFTTLKTKNGQSGILFGLGAVKGVGENAVTAIVREREKGAYKNIFDFCQRVDTAECNKRVVDSLIRVGAFDCTGANRPQMLHVYEPLLDSNAKSRKSNVDGQMSLFDMSFGEDTVSMFDQQHTLPDLPDYSLRQRLAMEKEMSGVYITGHPLDDYREQLSQFSFSTADLEALEDMDDGGMHLDGHNVEMAGILTEVKGKSTKKGAYMGFLTLEDLTGQIECLVFPKVFEKYQGLLAADDIVVLTGKLSIREEESPKLLVDMCVPLEEWHASPASPGMNGASAGRPAAGKHIRPEAPKLTDAQLAAQSPRKLYVKLNRPQMDACMHALSLHPGSVPVYLHIPQEKMTFLAPRLNWCDASEACLTRLAGLFDASGVKLVVKQEGEKP